MCTRHESMFLVDATHPYSNHHFRMLGKPSETSRCSSRKMLHLAQLGNASSWKIYVHSWQKATNKLSRQQCSSMIRLWSWIIGRQEYCWRSRGHSRTRWIFSDGIPFASYLYHLRVRRTVHIHINSLDWLDRIYWHVYHAQDRLEADYHNHALVHVNYPRILASGTNRLRDRPKHLVHKVRCEQWDNHDVLDQIYIGHMSSVHSGWIY